MRIQTAEPGGGNRRGRKKETSYQQRSRRDARKRSTAQAITNFFRDIQTGLIVALFLFTFGIVALFGLRQMGYENEVVALKHIVAGADCVVAEWLDMAPAKMEEPGYWMHLDADKDGTTCEEGA